jgi:hypothetical protein
MSDFTLEPDQIEPEHPERSRPVRLVSTGLAPTADVPTSRRTRDHPRCSAPCEACGAPVLTGVTAQGQRLALDTQVATYVVIWASETPVPRLVQSQGYPVLRCRRELSR